MEFSIACEVSSIPTRNLRAAVRSLGSFEALAVARDQELKKYFSEPEAEVLNDIRRGSLGSKKLNQALDSIRKVEASVVSYGTSNYPVFLKEISDPPLNLYVRGDIQAMQRPSIAIVGSRRCTRHGELIATRFAKTLSNMGFVITSGLARGIDSAGHKGALLAANPTVAVMATGIDRLYPADNKNLAEEILEKNGALVTEYIPGTPPKPYHFPRRNRIVTGLSLGVVVVEASEKSGSLISARLAVEQGREVFAIPGSSTSISHTGCHQIIRDGAVLVTEPSQVLEQLGPLWDFYKLIQSEKDSSDRTALTPEMVFPSEYQWVKEMLEQKPMFIEELVQLSSFSAAQVHSKMVALELEGLVEWTDLGYQLKRI